MSIRLHRKLKSLWDHPLAAPVQAHKVTADVAIEVNQAYYVANETTKAHRGSPRHDFWKALVLEIRTLPSDISDGPLILMQWFWSKKDIEKKFLDRGIEIPQNMRRALESMGDMEICPSLAEDINSIECLYGVADVVELCIEPNGTADSGSVLEQQTYVAEYFYRSGFDDEELTLRGHSTLGCGKEGCTEGWNPDIQEQRYCYPCRLWFHLPCLRVAEGKTQEGISDAAFKDDNPAKLPKILFDMAYQPAGRGGERHFPAGNIRLVSMARQLLRDEMRRREFTRDQNLDHSQWKTALLKHFKIKNAHEGRVDREQLVLYEQMIYTCSICAGLL